MTEFEIRSRDLDDYDLTSPIAHFRSLLVRGSIFLGLTVGAVAIVLVPAMRDHGRIASAANGTLGLDTMTTGSIGSTGSPLGYRIQRSVLQSGGPCLQWPDGRTQGAC